MVASAVVAGMLLGAVPEAFPAKIGAVEVLEGTGRLILDGRAESPPQLFLLPKGVFFTSDGYKRLELATTQLQDDVHALRLKLNECRPQPCTCPPVPITVQTGWSTKTLLVVLVAGLAVGASAVVLLR